MAEEKDVSQERHSLDKSMRQLLETTAREKLERMGMEGEDERVYDERRFNDKEMEDVSPKLSTFYRVFLGPFFERRGVSDDFSLLVRNPEEWCTRIYTSWVNFVQEAEKELTKSLHAVPSPFKPNVFMTFQEIMNRKMLLDNQVDFIRALVFSIHSSSEWLMGLNIDPVYRNIRDNTELLMHHLIGHQKRLAEMLVHVDNLMIRPVREAAEARENERQRNYSDFDTRLARNLERFESEKREAEIKRQASERFEMANLESKYAQYGLGGLTEGQRTRLLEFRKKYPDLWKPERKFYL